MYFFIFKNKYIIIFLNNKKNSYEISEIKAGCQHPFDDRDYFMINVKSMSMPPVFGIINYCTVENLFTLIQDHMYFVVYDYNILHILYF